MTPKRSLLNFIILLLLLCSFPARAVQIGDTASNIRLETMAGDTFDLSAHAGEVVLIYTFGCT